VAELDTADGIDAESTITQFVFTPRGGVERLSGRVRTLTVYQAMMQDSFGDWVEQTPVKMRTERFDERGAVIERDRYGDTGELVDRAVFAYDAQGRLIERTHYDTAGVAYLRYAYGLDDAGRLVEMTGLDPSGAQRSHLRRRYSPDGRLIGLSEWHDLREAVGETRWQIDYAVGGGPTQSDGQYLRDGELVERLLVRYDADGHVRENLRLSPDGEWTEKTHYLFGPQRERGNWVRRVTEQCVRRFGQEQFQPTSVTYRRFTFFG